MGGIKGREHGKIWREKRKEEVSSYILIKNVLKETKFYLQKYKQINLHLASSKFIYVLSNV